LQAKSKETLQALRKLLCQVRWADRSLPG